MVVGLVRLTLQIPDAGSLKSKRMVLRKVLDKVRARFQVSIAEVADQDLWQKATIGFAAVGNDRRFVNEVCDKVTSFIDGLMVAPIVERQMEIQSFGDGLYQEGGGHWDPEGGDGM